MHLNIDLLRLQWSHQATAILSSIRLLLLPCWILHDKWEASSSLVQHPLWLCIILYYKLKALSHPHREKKGCWTFLANESSCSATCSLVTPRAALLLVPSLLYPRSLNPRPLLTSPPFSGFKVGYGDVNRWYFSMLTVLKNRAGWLGAKSPWLPWSSNCLFPVLVCLGINYLCSACTGDLKETEDTR